MNGTIFRLVCVFAAALMESVASAGVTSSPMSWSPDSRWLCYTACYDPARAPRPPVALFGRPSGLLDPPPAMANGRHDPAAAVVYRIWATDQLTRATVLIEESSSPLSAPAWDARGKSVAFGRFVPASAEAAGSSQPGRLEVVIQQGLDEKSVVWTSPDFVLDAANKSALPFHRFAWSPDGVYLAIPHPGRVPSVDLIRTDTKKRVHVLDHAALPTWSPDGSMCAYIRCGIGANQLEIVQRRGQLFGEPRSLLATGPTTAAPVWSPDGRSILVVAEQTTRRTREYELIRCPLDSSERASVLNLVPDPIRRVAKIRGIVIDFDKDCEMGFHAADLENRESEMISSFLRDSQIHRRNHPVDASLSIGAIAASPDGRTVAVRLGDRDALSHPALFSTETEQTRLLAPDEPARREWLMLLANAAERLLKGSLATIALDKQTIERPSLLPLPGEVAAMGNAGSRLLRIAELGESVLPSRDNPGGRAESEADVRLLFDYLRGNFGAASDDLEVLDRETTDLSQRLGLLYVRAVIHWCREITEGQNRSFNTWSRRLARAPSVLKTPRSDPF